MSSTKHFSKDFILVVIGQIISLFGNSVLRFVLPLHLLNITGSAALYGFVSAFSFIPMLVMSPIGGVVADRINKRNIMVGLDFFTGGIIAIFFLVYQQFNLVVLILIVLVLLYGISGAYQPSVQASLPFLVSEKKLVPANAIINMVSSLANLIGPVLGGILYSMAGLRTILVISTICFIFSAVMELFIHIPFRPMPQKNSIVHILTGDLKQSLTFIIKTRPIIGKIVVIIALFNLFLSAILIIGIPVIVKQVLPLKGFNTDEMLGYIQGIMALGGLSGGLFASTASKKLKVQSVWKLLLIGSFLLLPMGIILFLPLQGILQYGIFSVCCFAMMLIFTLTTVQLMAYIQTITPEYLIGKVIAWILSISGCFQPIGQALYGVLFESMKHFEGLLFLGAAIIAAGLSIYYKKLNKQLVSTTNEKIKP
ncbi:MAG: MFS transporter [Massilioclostridium sp.]|nr:MAG: MFS transporter [Massilioclostridium sp.]